MKILPLGNKAEPDGVGGNKLYDYRIRSQTELKLARHTAVTIGAR